MSLSLTVSRRFLRSLRIALLVSGVLAFIAGAAILLWPDKSAKFLMALIAGYLIVAGLVYLAIGVFSRNVDGWSRVGHGVLGLLYVAAGAGAFYHLATATTVLALVFALIIGFSWIVDGIVSLSLLGDSSTRGWTILYAILSILGGVTVFFVPLFAAVLLWWIVGVTLVVLGVVQLVRASWLGSVLKPRTSKDTPVTAPAPEPEVLEGTIED